MICLFKKVTFTCNHCQAKQRIPLRRLHFFERIQELRQGRPVLISCPTCREGLQIPSPYRSHTGVDIDIDPENIPRDAFIHSGY